MAGVRLIEREYKGTEVSEKNKEILGRWTAKLAEGGNEVPAENAKVALQAMSEWDEPTVKGRPSIVTPYMGFGKSLLLETYLWEKLREQDTTTGRKDIRTNFGAIIVKHERGQVKALVDALNEGQHIPGRPDIQRKDNYVMGLYGYNPNAEDYKDDNGDWRSMTPEYNAYRRQKTEQENYNIIVMTSEKLKQLTLQNDLDSYRSFKNDGGDRCDRPLLIIDEKPIVLENHQITHRDLNEVIEWAAMQRGQHYRELIRQVRKLRDVLENPDIENKKALAPDRDGHYYFVDKRILDKLGNANDYERLTKLKVIEHIVRYGGRVSKYEKDGQLVQYISCAIKVHYDWTHLNASILDGTGHLAKEYKLINETLTLIRPEVPPQYENLHYYISEAHNLTKTSLEGLKDSEVIEKMKQYCEEIQRRHPDTKFLVITYQKYEEALADELEGNLLLRTKYFNGGRASNDYIDCNGVIFLGNWFKTEDYYVNMASVINGELLEHKHVPSKQGGSFTDDDVEDFKLANMLEDFMQELSRTRPVQKQATIPVYMFTKDQSFIDRIKTECPGATFSRYSAPIKITGKESTQHEIAKLIYSMKPGDKVKKSDWYKSKGIKESTFRKAKGTQTVKDALIFAEVVDRGQYFIKL